MEKQVKLNVVIAVFTAVLLAPALSFAEEFEVQMLIKEPMG